MPLQREPATVVGWDVPAETAPAGAARLEAHHADGLAKLVSLIKSIPAGQEPTVSDKAFVQAMDTASEHGPHIDKDVAEEIIGELQVKDLIMSHTATDGEEWHSFARLPAV